MEYLKAQTVRSAKVQAKRLYPEGGTIYGYCNELGSQVVVYICHIRTQVDWGRRRCVSDRLDLSIHYEQPHYFTFSED